MSSTGLRAALVTFAGVALAVGALGAATQSTHAQVGPSQFVATPVPSVSMLPACGKGLVSSAGPPYYGDYRVDDAAHVTVALSSPTGAPCELSGFPAIVFAAPLPRAHYHSGASVRRAT